MLRGALIGVRCGTPIIFAGIIEAFLRVGEAVVGCERAIG